MMHISPISTKFINFPYFIKISKFSHIFVQFTFLAKFTFYCFPYFDQAAFVHHALHVLDAPDTDIHKMTLITEYSAYAICTYPKMSSIDIPHFKMGPDSI